MFYKINGGALDQVPPEQWNEAQVVLISNEYAARKLENQVQWHGMPDGFFMDMLENDDVRFESHVDFDMVCLPSFDGEAEDPLEDPAYLLMDKKQLILFVKDVEKAAGALETMAKSERLLTPGFLVHQILEVLIDGEENRVEELEKEVSDKEELVEDWMESDDYIREIVTFRKHLLKLKHFYEHLKRVLEYMVANENQVFDKRTIKKLAILQERCRGMIEDIQVLREEVMQLREGYQSQRDLRMNKTMQFLTVVTTIFMPLTLLAGWYGMNLKMPEYQMDYAYPVLIGVCVFTILVGIWIGKKKKWF